MGKDKKHKKEKKHKKDKKKHKKHKRRHSSSSPEPQAKRLKPSPPTVPEPASKKTKSEDEADYSVPLPPGFSAAPMAPMTKEQWEAKQKQIRRVLDPETGRYRLIRGEGEIIEEPVSKARQIEINKTATKADGESFQRGLAARFK